MSRIPQRPAIRSRLHDVDVRLFEAMAPYRLRHLRWLRPLTHAADHSKLWIASSALLARFGGERGRRTARRGLVTVLATSVTANVVAKPLAPRLRPSRDRLHPERALRRFPTSSAMPSGHAASAASFATAVALTMPEAAPPVALLALCVGASRVYVGAHYPGDVLAGAALGAGVALAVGALAGGPARGTRGNASAPAPACPRGRDVAIVLNSRAGSAGSLRSQLQALLPEARLLEVNDPRDLGIALRHAADAAVIGICGGDGSVRTAAEVALEQRRPLLVLPGGTLNHLAHDLQLESVAAAADAVTRGRALRMDVGTAAGHLFVNTAAVGAYPEMVQRRERRERRLGKWPALAIATLETLREAEPLPLRIDGEEHAVIGVLVSNGPLDRPGFGGVRRSRLDGGLFDVRRVNGRSPRARLPLPWTARRWKSRPGYAQWNAVKVTVDGVPRAGLALDGDLIDAAGSIELANLTRALTVYCGEGAVS